MIKAYNKNEVGLGDLGNIRRLVYFVAVVETGSFTAAAERLGITKTVVSQQVARLEQEFRTTLLTRSTRKVQPTDAGQTFYHRCTLILHETENAFSELAEIATEPSGTLRITAPLDYGINVLVPKIVAFNQRYPNCNVNAIFNDQIFDLMAGNTELAIRVGWLPDSNLQAREIGTFRQILVASPKIAEQIKNITAPNKLSRLPFIANTALRTPLSWNFSLQGTSEQQNTTFQASIFFDATLAVHEAVKEGAGLSVLPDFTIRDDLACGRLIPVLPHWTLPTGGIHAVFPSARFRPMKVRSFVDFLVNG
jgi:DNA-binding transcriptional LysR family regulator